MNWASTCKEPVFSSMKRLTKQKHSSVSLSCRNSNFGQPRKDKPAKKFKSFNMTLILVLKIFESMRTKVGTYIEGVW